MLTVKKSQNNFLKLLILFIAIMLPWVIGYKYVNKMKSLEKSESVKLVNFTKDTIPRVDHSKFRILQQDFTSPEQVTEACMACHNLTGHEFMKTSHWSWSQDYVTDAGNTIQLGKKDIINNFCIGLSSNEPRCTSCHAGYGWKDHKFDFTDSKNIDCIVCHDQTGTYKKFPAGAGYPVTEPKVFGGKTFHAPDYVKIAQNVGNPTRENCGSCHYFGGGGNNVKHGDLAVELNHTTKKVDVHMGIDGADMQCVDCHKGDRHNIPGNLYSIASIDSNRISCEQCHTSQPHKNKYLNHHNNKVACQTCHIPSYAKVSATKMYWDWSTAGKLNPDGSNIVEKDEDGNISYHSMKGTFVWDKNVVPEYLWFNGTARHYVMGDKVDTTNSIELNTLLGSYDDKNSKIIPVKVYKARQIYDPVNSTLISPHLFGKDSTAYWGNYDWNKAAETGMKSMDLPYSGKYAFVPTSMYWPVNHMVAPREESLQCINCHSRDSRLSELTDFYLPGRDRNKFLDFSGIGIIILAFLGVIVHASLRIIKK